MRPDCVEILRPRMSKKMPRLPKYVFQRAKASYRYKRNVPTSLSQMIPKATVYQQLGNSYYEAIRRLPKVHAKIEALFDLECITKLIIEPNGEKFTNR